ncbi:MAG: asparagine synthetase B, partial [Cyclobacteriaceae bacterium]
MKKIVFLILTISTLCIKGSTILVHMDKNQSNHLKAYGITYWWLQKGGSAEWLLNYKSGSFSFSYHKELENELNIRNVSYKTISDVSYQQVKSQLASPNVNADVLELKKAPKIAVYSPKTKQPWDDAVTLVLTYAEIPYEVIFDDEILNDVLLKYDWLHLHHEDFSGQYGKFYAHYRNAPWYIAQKKEYEASAHKHGFSKVSHLKLATVKKIRNFCTSGGFLFAMCSATDTYDIALAADGLDICESMFDGDPADRSAQKKLHFENTFAFENFQLVTNPYQYEYSNIDNNMRERGLTEK